MSDDHRRLPPGAEAWEDVVFGSMSNNDCVGRNTLHKLRAMCYRHMWREEIRSIEVEYDGRPAGIEYSERIEEADKQSELWAAEARRLCLIHPSYSN